MECLRCCRSFLAQVPIVTGRFIATLGQSLHPTMEPTSNASRKRPLDVFGLVIFALTMGSLLLLVQYGSKDEAFTDNPMITALAISFTAFAISFILIETCWATAPMLAPSLLKRNEVR